MWRTSLLLIFTLLFSFNVQAAETAVVERVIVTPTPAPKETIVAPAGYTNCFTVAAGWFNNLWVPAHQVCQYAGSAEGVAWVEGYWACDKYGTDGVCTNWDWKPGRWVKTLEVY